jgi:WD40 repeat protein
LWQAHSGTANGSAFSPDGKLLATAGGDGVRLWEISTRKELAHLRHDGEAYGVEFSPDGNTIATCGIDDHLVKLWDVAAFMKGKK